MVLFSYRGSIAAIVLLAASPSFAALILGSSSRSVTATAQTGLDGLPVLPPSNPVASDSLSSNGRGSFNYSTGNLFAYGQCLVLPAGFTVQTSATTSASITSLISSTLLSSSSTLYGTADGQDDQPSQTSAQSLYSASFQVFTPTAFTLTGSYNLPNPITTYSDHLKLTLNGFLNLDLTGGPAYQNTINVSGVLQPGTAYTLAAELDLSTYNSSPNIHSGGTISMDFALALPEPGLLAPVIGLVVGLRRVRRR